MGLLTTKNSLSRAWIFCGTLCLGFLGTAFAVDRYVVDVPGFLMVGDSEGVLTVTPLSVGEVDLTPHKVSFIGLPKGVRIESMSGASSPLTVTGATQFRVSLDPTFSEKGVLCRVQKEGEPLVRGAGYFNVESTLDHFQITPAGMTAPVVGAPFRFQIVAMDGAGAVVRSYKDTVELKSEFGSLQETLIPGDSFKNGVALMSVTFNEADPPGRLNRLVATAQRLYPGQDDRATGTVELAVQAGGGHR